jgi:hypothetical protein
MNFIHRLIGKVKQTLSEKTTLLSENKTENKTDESADVSKSYIKKTADWCSLYNWKRTHRFAIHHKIEYISFDESPNQAIRVLCKTQSSWVNAFDFANNDWWNHYDVCLSNFETEVKYLQEHFIKMQVPLQVIVVRPTLNIFIKVHREFDKRDVIWVNCGGGTFTKDAHYFSVPGQLINNRFSPFPSGNIFSLLNVVEKISLLSLSLNLHPLERRGGKVPNIRYPS